MLNRIKESFKYLTIVIGIILLVPTFFYLIIRIPEVQTIIVKRITSHFSNEIKSTISVGRIEYAFFNKLIIDDLLIKDRNNDTLIYSKKVKAGLRKLDLKNNVIRLGHVELYKPTVAIVTDTTGLMNLNWYLGMLAGQGTGEKKNNSVFSVSQVSLKDTRFRLQNLRFSNRNKKSIDFNNLLVRGINGDVFDFSVINDSVSFSINSLDFIESHGFRVRQLSCDAIFDEHDMIFNNISLNCDSTIINADHVAFMADSARSYNNFNEEVKMDILLQKSLVNCSDLKYFVPALEGLKESVDVEGRISGTIAEFKGKNIKLSHNSYSYLDCDFNVTGLPFINNAFIYIDVNELKTNAKDIDRIKLPGKGNIVLPPVLYKLGNISFNGSFTGFINDFVTYGRIGTEEGSLRTDISLRPEGKNGFRIKGLVKGDNINLGDLTDNTALLGKLSMETNIDAKTFSGNKIEGNLIGNIDSIEIKNYVYRNVRLNGVFSDKTWDGTIDVADKNVRMNMLGMFDFSKDLPEFDFTLNLANANLYNLNFDESDSTSQLSMLATANFKGNSIDNLYGEIKLLNSTVIKYGNRLDLYDFSLKAFTENNKPAISIKTDFVDADLRGYYNFGGIETVYKTVLSSLFPSLHAPPLVSKDQVRNDFVFNVNFKNTDRINNFFKTGILIADKSVIKGAIHPDNSMLLNASAKKLSYNNNIISDLSINVLYSGKNLKADLGSSSFLLLGQSELKDFGLNFNSIPDSFVFTVNWDDREKVLNKGDFIARGSFVSKKDGSKGAILKIDIDSSKVFTRNNLWKINQSSVLIDSSSVDINKFRISSRDNFYLADGTVSRNENDTLHLEFKGVDLNIFNPEDVSKNALPLNLKGIVNGNIFLSNLLNNPLFESDLKINGFSILGANYGDISIISAWNPAHNVADLSAVNNLNGTRNLDVKGTYNPGSQILDLNARTSRLPIDALNPILNSFASNIKGSISGKVNLKGTPDKLILSGAVMTEEAGLTIDYLKTRYTLSDSVRFDKSGIKFRNVKIRDEKGNPASVSGTVYHKYFKDFSADLSVNMNEKPCLVLKTQQKDNESFYGTAYATGVTKIKSGPKSLTFDISAKAEAGTRFYIPLNTGLSVTQHSFVTFINPDTAKNKNDKKTAVQQVQNSGFGMELNLDLDIAPGAEVQLLIDPKANDVIKGKGTGKLNISLDKKGEFKIYGDYNIAEGGYLFTLGNLFNKDFEVQNEGKISFNGNIEDAEIDLTANYKKLRTSLYPILQDEKYNDRIDVEPQLILSGKLFNPVVGLNIYLPNADEETRTYLKNAINTEEDLSRQFLYLLVMNSFYSDATYSNSSSTATTGTSAMAVTTTEMLSNQVSNWLSQISNDFDVGFLYRPGNKDINSQELEVALSTQLLNDKVSINGNFDVRGTDNNSEETPLTGDFDIEYKITQKLRFKVFNRYNNPYTGRGVPYTQGLGLFFNQDFNKLSDLFKKREKSEMKKEKEVPLK